MFNNKKKKKSSSSRGRPPWSESSSNAAPRSFDIPTRSRDPVNVDSQSRRHEASVPGGLVAISNGYPEEIQDDIKAVRRLINKARSVQCHTCRSDLFPAFSIKAWFVALTNAQDSGSKFSLCAFKCIQCQLETCAGCAKPTEQSAFVSSARGSKLIYCCKKGLTFATWALLCAFDGMELSSQHIESVSAERNRPSASTNKGGSGVGYGSTPWNDAMESYRRRDRFTAPPSYLSFNTVDDRYDESKRRILELIKDLLLSQAGKSLGSGLADSVELSFVQDRAAQILRNDSMAEVSKRKDMLEAVVALMEALVMNEDTRYLVTDARWAKKRSPGLAMLSLEASTTNGQQGNFLEVEKCKDDMSSSLLISMKNLQTQCQALLSACEASKGHFADSSGRELVGFAKRINQVYQTIKENEGVQPEQAASEENAWKAFNAKHRVQFVDGVMSRFMPQWQAFARDMSVSRPGRMKKIMLELTDMTTSLPDGIFLCAQWERPDVMKCMIVGPEGTPYEGGLFEFDIACPATYPLEPPKVIFRGACGVHYFNPNLHLDGKVCLSLLGTWPGPPESQWHPHASTILQVLISIQGMILGVTNPILNEPGFEHGPGGPGGSGGATVPGGSSSSASAASFARMAARMTRHVRALTAKHAMLDWLVLDAAWFGFWRNLLRAYFRSHGAHCVATVRRWAREEAAALSNSNPDAATMAGRGVGVGGRREGSVFGATPELGPVGDRGLVGAVGAEYGADVARVLELALTRRLEQANKS